MLLKQRIWPFLLGFCAKGSDFEGFAILQSLAGLEKKGEKSSLAHHQKDTHHITSSSFLFSSLRRKSRVVFRRMKRDESSLLGYHCTVP